MLVSHANSANEARQWVANGSYNRNKVAREWKYNHFQLVSRSRVCDTLPLWCHVQTHNFTFI
jgi:hypothetical protein